MTGCRIVRRIHILLFCIAACTNLCRPPVADGGDLAKLAEATINDSGWSRGICIDLSADPELALALAGNSELSIYRVEKDAAEVSRVRKQVRAAGLGPPFRVLWCGDPVRSYGEPWTVRCLAKD
jgi:hypothetical protein